MSGYITFEEISEIESVIFQRCSFGEIAKKINKDRSTISREIRKHSVIEKVVTVGSDLMLAYKKKPAKWVWFVEISVLKPHASCAEPAVIVITTVLNLQSRFAF